MTGLYVCSLGVFLLADRLALLQMAGRALAVGQVLLHVHGAGALLGHVGNVEPQVDSGNQIQNVGQRLKQTKRQVQTHGLENAVHLARHGLLLNEGRGASHGGAGSQQNGRGQNQHDVGGHGGGLGVLGRLDGHDSDRLALAVGLVSVDGGRGRGVGEGAEGLDPGGGHGGHGDTLLGLLVAEERQGAGLEHVGQADDGQAAEGHQHGENGGGPHNLLAHGVVLLVNVVEVGHDLGDDGHDQHSNHETVDEVHDGVEPRGGAGFGMTGGEDSVGENDVHDVDDKNRSNVEDERGDADVEPGHVLGPAETQGKANDLEEAVDAETERQVELVALHPVTSPDVQVCDGDDGEDGDEDSAGRVVLGRGVVAEDGSLGRHGVLDHVFGNVVANVELGLGQHLGDSGTHGSGLGDLENAENARLVGVLAGLGHGQGVEGADERGEFGVLLAVFRQQGHEGGCHGGRVGRCAW